MLWTDKKTKSVFYLLNLFYSEQQGHIIYRNQRHCGAAVYCFDVYPIGEFGRIHCITQTAWSILHRDRICLLNDKKLVDNGNNTGHFLSEQV